MTEDHVVSTVLGARETEHLQPVISQHREPGLIYVPSGTWEGSVIVAQHNITLVGAGPNKTILEGERGQPAIAVIAPNVRIVNMGIRTEYDVPAIGYTHGAAPQGVIQNVTILESGSHGIYRSNGQPELGSQVNAIIDCNFHDIGGHGIAVESGSGPQNLVRGNVGENIDGDFIQWGVDASLLLDNRCEDAPIRLTSNASNNWVGENESTELIDESDGDNTII